MSDLPPPPPAPAGGSTRRTELAGFWIRFAAALVDGIILGIPIAILSAMADSGSRGFSTGGPWRPDASVGVNLLGTVVGVLYYSLLEGGPTGQTLGKSICGIRVVDATSGLPGIGPGRGVGRYFARWLSSIPLALGYLWMLWDERNQTWHDKLASTVVVRT